MRSIEGTQITAGQKFRSGGIKYTAIVVSPGVDGALKVMAVGPDDKTLELRMYPGAMVTLTEETEPDPAMLASRITRAEVQAFLDGSYAKHIAEGMTRIEVLPISRNPSAESIDYRWKQEHRPTLGTEMGWVQVGRGQYGQIVLLESSSDWDDE